MFSPLVTMANVNRLARWAIQIELSRVTITFPLLSSSPVWPLQQGILSGALLSSFVSRPSPPFPVGRVASPFLTPSLVIRYFSSSCSPPSLLGQILILILNPGQTFLPDTCLTLIRTCRSPTCFFSLLHL